MTPEDILHAEIPVADMERLRRAIEGMPFKAHALWALSHLLLEEGDRLGSKIVEEWAEEFTQHEARRLRLARGRAASTAPAPRAQPPSPSARSLNLGTCSVQEFAAAVLKAARAARTGRWHGSVFVSGVWDELSAHGDPGLSLDRFKRRLFEAYQADLLDLSRADLVDAMPADEVAASEITHAGARFHLIRV